MSPFPVLGAHVSLRISAVWVSLWAEMEAQAGAAFFLVYLMKKGAHAAGYRTSTAQGHGDGDCVETLYMISALLLGKVQIASSLKPLQTVLQ